MRQGTIPQNEIKKLQVKEVTLFAINNIPQVDSLTLKRFLELVNAGGSFGAISHDQILRKMAQVLKYVPGACVRSLWILVDLLELEPTRRLGPDFPQPGRIGAGEDEGEAEAFFIEMIWSAPVENGPCSGKVAPK